MDPRVCEQAEILVDWCARVDAGDSVVVQVDQAAEPLAVAVAQALGERRASMQMTYTSGEVNRAYLTSFPDLEFPADPPHSLALFEHADIVLNLRGGTNTSALADVPQAVRQAASRASPKLRDAIYATDWVSTIHPTASLAQQANMSTAAYRDFAYGAIIRDWASLAEEMANLKDAFDEGTTVRLVAEGTDLTMAIDGRTAVNSAASVVYDSHNLPSGEVFTAPYATEGTVTFDVPMTIHGQPIRDVELTFEDGLVTDVRAGEGASVVAGILETDDGARRLGELGIGMNRGIDRYTNNILFDEKMAGTAHLALGRAYDACLPEGETGNESAVHVDLILDMSDDGARLEVDGEIVQQGGYFAWEDEFLQ